MDAAERRPIWGKQTLLDTLPNLDDHRFEERV